MKCPKCDLKTRVLDTRNQVYRRRECACGHRFWTHETATEAPERGTVATGQQLASVFQGWIRPSEAP